MKNCGMLYPDFGSELKKVGELKDGLYCSRNGLENLTLGPQKLKGSEIMGCTSVEGSSGMS